MQSDIHKRSWELQAAAKAGDHGTEKQMGGCAIKSQGQENAHTPWLRACISPDTRFASSARVAAHCVGLTTATHPYQEPDTFEYMVPLAAACMRAVRELPKRRWVHG